MDPVIAIVFIIYLVVVMGMGIYAARFDKSSSDFLLADRKMGGWVAAISSVASSESGWLVMGAVGEAYLFGLAGVWIAIGCLTGYIFNWFFFAERLRRYSKRTNALTIPDVIAERIEDRSHVVRIISVVVIFLLMFTYVAAQFTAAGKAFNCVFNWDYRTGVLVGALVTIIYTTLGGFRAVSWTDVLQGLLMVTALVILPILALIKIGGPVELINKINQQPALAYTHCTLTSPKGCESFRLKDTTYITEIAPDRFELVHEQTPDWIARIKKDTSAKKLQFILTTNTAATEKITLNDQKLTQNETLLAPNDSLSVDSINITFNKTYQLEPGYNLIKITGGRTGLVLLGFLIAMLGIGLGYPGTPHVLTRYMAARNKHEIRKGRLIAITWGILAMYGAVFTGLSAIVLLPEIGDPEHGLLEMAKLLLPPVLAGMVLAAVVAAIKSTADSQLLVAASAVSRDVYQKIMKREPDERKLVRITRISVLVLGLAALLLALTETRVVFWFVLFSWAGLGASFGPVLILAMYWEKLTKYGAAWGIVTGFVTTVVWKLLLRGLIKTGLGLDVYELVPAFGLAFLVTIIVSLATQRHKPGDLQNLQSRIWKREQ